MSRLLISGVIVVVLSERKKERDFEDTVISKEKEVVPVCSRGYNLF